MALDNRAALITEKCRACGEPLPICGCATRAMRLEPFATLDRIIHHAETLLVQVSEVRVHLHHAVRDLRALAAEMRQ
jgi:hypothetical protein